jgi:ribosomal protein S18 acetylase RimI-like enzyme
MEAELRVRRIHRRDLNRVWEFLKLVFRDVNRETVEYQRPRTKKRFLEVYEEEGVEQLVFEFAHGERVDIVGYAECTFEISGSSDNWMNHRYFERREMRPLFVEELAVHPEHQGKGIGRFMLEQLEHLAKLRGCTHLVLEVAENNQNALAFYKKRSFQKLDAAIFMAKRVAVEPELLPPRKLTSAPKSGAKHAAPAKGKGPTKKSVKVGASGTVEVRGAEAPNASATAPGPTKPKRSTHKTPPARGA